MDSSLPYQVVDPQWTVETTPGGPNITVTGTIQDVAARLTEANPNCKRDFKIEQISASPENFEKRAYYTIKVPEICNNAKRWSYTTSSGIRDGIDYLNKLSGTAHLGAGPNTCGRVSCSYGAAIWWCNDVSCIPCCCEF